MRHSTRLAALAVVLVSTVTVQAGDQTTPDVIKVGIINSLLKDVPVEVMAGPFGSLLTQQTGMKNQILQGGDADKLAQQLAEAKLQIGIFTGVELAWAKAKYPQLKPLVIAVNEKKHLRAVLVVRNDCAANGFNDLQGKTVCVPKGSQEHCLVFFQRRCLDGAAPSSNKIKTPADAESALDEVIDGEAEAAVIDAMALECYKQRKPGRATKLKVATTSEVFPCMAVVYRPGVLSEPTIKHLADSMIGMQKTLVGRQFLTLSRLTAFEVVPSDYEKILADIAKAYPPPPAAVAQK